MLAAVLAGWLSGCTPELCVRHSDCPPEQVCTPAGTCGARPVDAGVDDGDIEIIENEPRARATTEEPLHAPR